MAVVKANGYGLGASWMARAALEGGATRLAVACVDEGVQLRREGITGPILVMSYGSPSEAQAAVENGLTLAIHRTDIAAALEAAALRAGLAQGQVPIHIKVDTGLGRFGCTLEELVPLAHYVNQSRHLRLEGLMTHFAEADSQDTAFTRRQCSLFNELRAEAGRQGINFDVVHAANSSAMLSLPESRFDMVRVGIMLTGHYPSSHFKDAIKVEPAITIRTRLVRVFQVGEGESVGYGRTWVAARPSTIGLIPAGYADGYVRLLSNRGAVLVRGQRCPVAGRISMDQSAVDLTDVPEAQEGDEVVLVGKQAGAEITADEVAKWAETISYELFTGIGGRVPRRYYRDGRLKAVCTLLGCS